MYCLLRLLLGLLCWSIQYQVLLASTVIEQCPANCKCTPLGPKITPQSDSRIGSSKNRGPVIPSTSNNLVGTKVRCGDTGGQVASLAELEPTLFPKDTVQLDLHGNLLTDIPKAAFAHLPLLQKLDLRNNEIHALAPESFSNLTNLKRLDLSNNKLPRLSGGVFLGLEKLTTLRLAENQLVAIAEGTFDDLISLKNLDLSHNPLNCDCHLSWLVDWLGNESVKLNEGSQCINPPILEGQELSRLQSSALLCRSSTTPIQNELEMQPENDQVVFERDSIRLACVVTGAGRSSVPISWLWQGNKNISFPGLRLDNRYIPDKIATVSSITIPQLGAEHTGKWECIYGNLSHSISLLVISASTQFCMQTVTSGNKGAYTWPRSVVGTLVELNCAATPPTPLTSTIGSSRLAQNTKAVLNKPLVAKASHRCGQHGAWQELNTSACAFLSDTTKALEQFAKLLLTKATVLQTAQRLRNFTGDLQHLKDKMDIVFLSRTIENHLEFITKEKELAPLLVAVIGASTFIPSNLLAEAQIEDNAAQRIIDSAEAIAEHSTSSQVQPGVAVEALWTNREGLQGVTCAWYADPLGVRPRLFHCSSHERTLPPPAAVQDMDMLGSVQLPASLFLHLPKQVVGSGRFPQLIVSMFANGHLFPELNVSSHWKVTSCVIGCKLVSTEKSKIEEILKTAPVWVTLKAPVDSAARPVIWDGRSAWTEDGCTFTRTVGNLVVFQCTKLGYFALRQDLSPPNNTAARPPPLPSRMAPPALYAGTLILGVCLLLAITTYIMCNRDLEMPEKSIHSLVNTWLAIFLLSITFSCGIYQTGYIFACQTVGLLLHYLSLCSLLWMTVTVSNLHKQLTAGENESDDEEDPGELPVPPQPMLGFYLVGWGIALIICGISGAVNLRHYAGPTICFLGPAASISAVLVPCGAILAVFLLLWLLANCAASRKKSESGRISQGTQQTERVDLELLGPRPPSPCLTTSSSKCSEEGDLERTPRSQLLAHLFVILLFLLAWACGAVSVANPTIPHQATIFSSLYAVACTILGIFVLIYFCAGRKDVKNEWKLVGNPQDWWCRGKNTRLLRPTLIIHPPPPPPSTHNTTLPRAAPSITLSAIASAIPPPSQAMTIDEEIPMSKSCIDEEERVEVELLEKVCQLRDIVLPPASVITEGSIGGAELFYNPHQLGVARKFFKKQRLLKRNNAAAAATSCAATSDGESIFSSGSKVNNTNIHANHHISAKLNNCVNRDPNIRRSDFTTHRNVFERRAHSPISSVSEARAPRSRRPYRARSADELGDNYDDGGVGEARNSRRRARRRHRRSSRGPRIHESSLASVTSLRTKTFAIDTSMDSDTKKETCV